MDPYPVSLFELIEQGSNLCYHHRLYDPLDFQANIKAQEIITTTFTPKLAELMPGGAAYLNEGDFREPDFQQVFYGANYQRLLGIKHKYDPEDVLYALTAVGSEAWTTEPEGRLCRVPRGSGQGP